MNSRTISIVVLVILGVALLAAIVRLLMPDTRSGLSFQPLPENAAVKAAVSPTSTKPTMNDNTATLQITDTKVGTGAEAVAGKRVTVHYVGTLDNGTKFDSSRDRGTPFTFVLGAGQVIQGWDEGFAGMKVGGIRKLVIPAELAYGDTARGSIPANSTLHFEVELLAVQ